MNTRILGQSGVSISEVGFGTWKYKGDPDVLQHALDLGSTFIDTAESYGTESAVGKSLLGRRHDAFIATKVSPWNFRYPEVIKAAENSLKNLSIDTIDLYQLHAPNRTIPIEETMGAMRDLVSTGKVRFIGVSNFSVGELVAAQSALGNIPIVSNQIKYSIFDHEFADPIVTYCQDHGIAILAYSPLEASGYQNELKSNQPLQTLLKGMSEETGKTQVQILLRWGLQKENVITIPATNDLSHLQENIGASGWTLDAEQYATLNEAVKLKPSNHWWR